MPDAKSSTVVVQRGVYTVARKTVDTEGNTIRETPPQWREDITGGSVIVCPINSETDEPLCDAELFSALSQDVLLDSLGKALGFHWPNFAAIFEKMRERWISASSAARTCKSVCFAPSIPTTISLHSRRMAGGCAGNSDPASCHLVWLMTRKESKPRQ